MTGVRAITIKQPWAWAVSHGGKTVENRSRGTTYRGPLFIHAGKAWSMRGVYDPRVTAAWRIECPEQSGALLFADLPLGAVVAVAHLVDCHPDAGCCRPWGETTYTEAGGRTRTAVHHLLLEDVMPLAVPVPCRGALGLWRPPDDVIDAVWATDVDMEALR